VTTPDSGAWRRLVLAPPLAASRLLSLQAEKQELSMELTEVLGPLLRGTQGHWWGCSSGSVGLGAVL